VEVQPFFFEDIDEKIADSLEVAPRQLAFNGLAVHPTERAVYLSLGVKISGAVEPAVVRVSLSGDISLFELGNPGSSFKLSNVPSREDLSFAGRRMAGARTEVLRRKS
jgi:hypothetical protein